MPLFCRHCGAPLPVQQHTAIIVCPHCKVTNDTRKQAAPGHIPGVPPGGFVPAPGAYPPPPGAYPPAPGAPLQVSVSHGGARGLIVGLAAVGALIAAGAGFAVLGSFSGPSGSGAFSPRTHFGGGGCLVDANGDAVLDVVGMTGPPGESYVPTVVDGNSGKILWKGTHNRKDSRFMCLGTGHFAFDDPSFELAVHTARSPDTPARLKLRDRITKYGVAADCAAFETSDGSKLGVKLSTGAQQTCSPPGELRGIHEEVGELGSTTEAMELYRGKRRYVLRKRKSGTPMLEVSVFDDGKPVWTKELSYRSATFSSGMAVAGSRIVVFGARNEDDKRGLLIGLDEATGAEQYAVALEGASTWSVNMLAFNGRYVVVSYWVGLSAFDPMTGRLVWSLGG